jgi:cell wall-associated NlpC family hydrolase
MKEAKKATAKKESKTAKSSASKSAKAAAKSAANASPAKGENKASASSAAQPKPAAAPAGSSAAEATPAPAGPPALPSTHGKVGVFGGPKDRGIKPDDKLALPTGPHFVYERARTLNPKSFYCAMRWNYHLEHMSPEEAKRWWANKKILVTNVRNGASIVVRAVDYGPHENTGLDISLSPGGAEALSVEIGDEVDIAFADPSSKLGPVND